LSILAFGGKMNVERNEGAPILLTAKGRFALQSIVKRCDNTMVEKREQVYIHTDGKQFILRFVGSLPVQYQVR